MTGPPTTAGYEDARKRLVRRMAGEGIIRTPAIEAAFLRIPREAFVPADGPAAVYADTTIPISATGGEWLTTSSQPTMMAIMLEQLAAAPGDHVLEIGAGTGYNAALLADIAGANGSVDSIEVEAEAARHATIAIAAIGSQARVHHADGADGWPVGAPYDRIIATVAVWSVPGSWWLQAAPEARIVAPLTIIGSDYSTALVRDGEDWVSDSIEPCAFVRFRGRMAVPENRVMVGEPSAPALSLAAEPGPLPLARNLMDWLETGEGEAVRGLSERDAWDGLVLWFIRECGTEHLVRAISPGRGLGWHGPAIGLWDDEGMALVTTDGRLESFGAGETADAMRQALATWRTAGAPGLNRLRLRLRPGPPNGPGWIPRWSHSIRVEER